MKNTIILWTAVLSLLQLTACTSEAFKRAGYETLYHKQCMDDTGYQDCDPDHLSYDEYKKIRDAALEGRRVDR